MYYDNLIEVIISLGTRMLENGAEIKRCEDSMNRLLNLYNAEEIEIFTISNHITITAKFEGTYYTVSKTAKRNETNFYQLDKLNQLSRNAVSNKYSIEKLKEEFDRIVSEPKYPIWKLFIGSCLASAGFCLFFGGDWLDLIVSSLLGIIVVLSNSYIKPKLNVLLYTILISFIAGSLGVFCYELGFGHHLDKILIGDVMLLIPGIAMANSIRDLFLGDTISGILRFVESVLVAVCIALGFGLAIYLFEDNITMAPSNVKWYVKISSGVIGAMGYGINFHLRLKKLLFASFGAVFSLGTFVLMSQYVETLYVNILVSAMVACIYGEIMARIIKTPAICVMLAACVPLYPGGSLYYTLSNLVAKNYVLFEEYIKRTSFVILGIASGIVVSSAVWVYINKLYYLTKNSIIKKKI